MTITTTIKLHPDCEKAYYKDAMTDRGLRKTESIGNYKEFKRIHITTCKKCQEYNED